MSSSNRKIHVIRLLIRVPLFLLIVFLFVVSCLLASLFCRNRKQKLRVTISINKFFGQLALSLLKIKIYREGVVPDNQQFFIVSNHLSYIDPLVLFSSFRAIFVTSVEVRENPFLGPLCRLGECYFVERRNKFNIKKEISDVGSYLQLGFHLALFPEGTSTNGEQILRFKTSFFQVAVNEKASVLPVCLQYLTIDGQEITLENRASLYWYGNMSFFPHLAALLSLRSITLRIKVLEEIPIGDNDKNKLAAIAQERIRSVYFGK